VDSIAETRKPPRGNPLAAFGVGHGGTGNRDQGLGKNVLSLRLFYRGARSIVPLCGIRSTRSAGACAACRSAYAELVRDAGARAQGSGTRDQGSGIGLLSPASNLKPQARRSLPPFHNGQRTTDNPQSAPCSLLYACFSLLLSPYALSHSTNGQWTTCHGLLAPDSLPLPPHSLHLTPCILHP
jgi:hypothetical protein